MSDTLDTLYAEIPSLVLRSGVPGRHSARSALGHLEKARTIADIDMEMAAFRAITAEEEAATALLHALKRSRYPGAERLNVRNHIHKRACLPFMNGIASIIAGAQAAGTLLISIRLERADEDVPLKLEMWHPAVPIGQRARPVPPLGFSLRVNDAPAPLRAQMQRFADGSGAASIRDYLRFLANQRNEILYASHEGVPRVTTLNDLLSAQTLKVNRILLAFLMVDQIGEPQQFVQECLDGFLDMLGLLELGGTET